MSEVKTNGARSLGQGNIQVEGQYGEGRSSCKLHPGLLRFPLPLTMCSDLGSSKTFSQLPNGSQLPIALLGRQ